MKKMNIAKLAALMAVMTAGVAQAATPTITSITTASQDVVFSSGLTVTHTMDKLGPFPAGSAAALGNIPVALGHVKGGDQATHVAIEWDKAMAGCSEADPATLSSCTIKNTLGANPMTFKLTEAGNGDLANAGDSADGWFGNGTNALEYSIKLAAGANALGVYRLTVNAAAYAK